MDDQHVDPTTIGIMIYHPWGDIETTLQHWITLGPGGRPFVHPAEAWDVHTREPLPLSVIPFRYRNTPESMAWLLEQNIADPWGRAPDELRQHLDRKKATDLVAKHLEGAEPLTAEEHIIVEAELARRQQLRHDERGLRGRLRDWAQAAGRWLRRAHRP